MSDIVILSLTRRDSLSSFGRTEPPTMAADGEDFTRRKPLYGKVYRLSKEGRDVTEIAPCLMKGLRKEIASRPLYSLKDVSVALAGLDSRVRQGGDLFAGDVNFTSEAFERELEAIGGKFHEHDSTRHVLEAARHIKERVIQRLLDLQAENSAHQICELIVKDLCRQLAIDPMKDYHAFHRGLSPVQAIEDMNAVMKLADHDLRELAKDAWESPSARRSKKNGKGAIDHSPGGLGSEDISQ